MFIKLTEKANGKVFKCNADLVVLHHPCDDGVGSVVAFGPDFCRTVAESNQDVDYLLLQSELSRVDVPVPVSKKHKKG